MIVIDRPRDYGAPINARLGPSSHLASDRAGPEGSAELLEFALSIGMRADWLQHAGTHREHFDVFGARYQRAVDRGARPIGNMEFGRLLADKKRAAASAQAAPPAPSREGRPPRGALPLFERAAPRWPPSPGPKVYLIHADGALPNLALMKLAGYFSARGLGVELVRRPWRRELVHDRVEGNVYGSSIFSFSASDRAEIERAWGDVRWGGTGVDVASSLDEVDPLVDWDAAPVDYGIYPGYRHSIGFSQRGCRLRCPFCVVPRKEGAPRSTGTLAEIWRGPGHPKSLVLLDNDFFGQPEAGWRARIAEAAEGGYRLCFVQGINVRKVGDAEAAALASVQYRDAKFSRRRLYTAWDNLGDERLVMAGVDRLEAAGVPPEHLMVYMLVGYARGETWGDIFRRFAGLTNRGCRPYPMPYNREERPDLAAFQKWATMRFYRITPWHEFRDPRLRDVDRPPALDALIDRRRLAPERGDGPDEGAAP